MAKRKYERYRKNIEEQVKRAIGYGNDQKAAEAGAKLFKYLNAEQKQRAIDGTEPGHDPAKTYGRLLADKLKMKSNKGPITMSDVRSMATKMDLVMDSETRAREVMVRSWRNTATPNFYGFIKESELFKKKGPRSIAGIAQVFEYKGGTKSEGYLYSTTINGIAYEVQTPGYDEVQGRLHGFRWRNIDLVDKEGNILWIES